MAGVCHLYSFIHHKYITSPPTVRIIVYIIQDACFIFPATKVL